MEKYQKEKVNEDFLQNSINPLPSSPQKIPISKGNGRDSVKRYTSTQWVTFVTLALGNFSLGACFSLQAPFFPRQAEAKGATPTEYGLIFGSFQMAIFISSPVMGKLIAYIPPKVLLNLGLLTIGVANVVFGTLTMVPSGTVFVAVAFIIRIIQGIGDAAFKIAAYSIIVSQFKEGTFTTIGLLHTAYGIGCIAGPTLGGVLFDLGGFELPFFAMGILTLIATGIMFIILPNSERNGSGEKADALKFWLNPGICVYAFAIFTTYIYSGFNSATLEPHLRQFNVSGTLLGILIALEAGVFAVSAALWGWISDKKIGNKILVLIACCFVVVSLLVIGPMPFFNMETRLDLITIALVFMGLGLGGKLVCSFGGSFEDTIERGFPRDLNTYGLISSMITTSHAVGSFVGSSCGGFLVENIGYRMTTLIIFGLEILLMIILPVYAFIKRVRLSSKGDEEKPILSNNPKTQLRYS